MSVPKQALEQLEKAEAQLKELQNTTQVVEEAEGNDEALSSQNEETKEVFPQVDIEALQKDLDLERQRNASLKGRIDSQLKQANSENKELKDSLAEMKSQLEELKNVNKVPGSKRHISEQEAEELGDDVLDIQSRVIKGTLEEELESGKIKEYVNELINKSLKAQQEKQVPVVDTTSFWNNVEQYYPGAKTLNSTDTGWFSFLELYDTNSGLKNRDVGANAINNGDVATLVDLLKAYKPIGSVSVNEASVTTKPETTAHAKQVTQPEQPRFTKKGVQLFYKDLADGRFKGKKGKEEAEKIEAQIMEAAKTGRIF
jgi:hypothetical protein|tara:strand:+ start:1229 stop:2170 length:942 start_codon:yes stop_codon:yes gene_type:complete